jgi:hypothetical protein
MCAGLDVSPGLNCAKKNKNIGKKSLCSKLSAVVATANFQQRKTKKKICGFLSRIVSEKRLLSCSRWSAHCRIEMKTSLMKAKRERPALVAAYMWVYKGTVNSTKGTTWSGSPLWKEAQQEVRQHWFIDSYTAAYIQMQHRVGGVHPTGLTVARGVHNLSHQAAPLSVCNKQKWARATFFLSP